jgi:hypothetical protein
MTQAQRTHTSANGLVPAAVAGLVMVAALAGAILVNGLPTMSLTPGTGTVALNQALIRAAEDSWMQQRTAQSAAFDVMSSANRKSADQWEAMQHVLATRVAGHVSTYTEAERQAILRHQLMLPESISGLSALEAARKLQIERQVQSGVDFNGGSVDDVRTPTDPKLR